ncbi:MAG: hypothetical protein ABI769_06330 [Pseudomonadota bacterium]
MKPKSFAFVSLLGLLFGLAHPLIAHAQADQILPHFGGAGGGDFVARCTRGDILTGFELQTGDDVDSIRPICARPMTATSIGERFLFGRKFGGDGGGSTKQLLCPDNAPAIAGVGIDIDGRDTKIVNGIDIFCSAIVPNQPMTATAATSYMGPHPEGGAFTTVLNFEDYNRQICPAGLVPVGISGRSGVWLDSVGLICGATPPIQGTVQSIGRVGAPRDPQRPRVPICDAARSARARNSPAAADLEAQCEASKQPVSSIGRVDAGPSAPRPQRSICESAADARARNSPAAPNLEAQCQAIMKTRPSDAEFESVRASGERRAALDPTAGRIRSSLFEAPRRGFDIGLGAWADQTAPGPGKQRYHDYLTLAEQQGFNFAAAYAMPRNKYAQLVDIGLAINAADAQVRAARNASNDGFFWLGFDLASGLFGDPRAGAQGSKGFDAWAASIRSQLNAAGQAGFNASMQMHLARSYP